MPRSEKPCTKPLHRQPRSSMESSIHSKVLHFGFASPFRPFSFFSIRHAEISISCLNLAAQWDFYKQIRVLNPANLAELSHELSQYPALGLPVDGVSTDWLQYVRSEAKPSSSDQLDEFWRVRSGQLAKFANVLVHLLVTSGTVERSFSLAGNMDSKYRQSLPSKTRRITCMLMFNGDLEQRFGGAK